MTDCCKTCRYFLSEVIGYDFEPLDQIARCAITHKLVENDDHCNDFKKSLWAVAKENTEAHDVG